MTTMADEITESIKARIRAELAERQQRRERNRRVRADFDRKRRYAKDKIVEEKGNRA